MRFIGSCLAAAFVVSPTNVSAMPPAVPVAPLVLSTADDVRIRTELVQLIEQMAKEGHFGLVAIAERELAPDACLAAHRPDNRCLANVAPVGVEAEPKHSVVIDAPQWRQASVRIRCVGPDIKRARQIELYLADARSEQPKALPEKAKLAGCMIGSLHGSPSNAADW